MKVMTTAEFTKATLTSITEPVKIRRYTRAVGTYYPEGYIASLPGEEAFEATVVTDGGGDPALALISKDLRIEDLEAEVKRLKQKLAAKMETFSALQKRTGTVAVEHPLDTVEHPLGRAARTVAPRTVPEDAFAGLAKQDREFFERKLGKKK